MDEKQAPEKTQWYALRSMRRSILGCKSRLTDLHIEHFIPMVKIKTRTPSGRFRWNEQPLAFNYVFVHSTAAALNDLKQTRLPNLCYLMRPNEKGFDAKVIVPDEQMRNFIAIAGTSEERILYLPYSEVDLAHGDRVRITGGTFEGVEGIYQRIKGVRDKQVVVCIEGLVAVATATVPAYLVEKI